MTAEPGALEDGAGAELDGGGVTPALVLLFDGDGAAELEAGAELDGAELEGAELDGAVLVADPVGDAGGVTGTPDLPGLGDFGLWW